jgi:integrase
MPSSIGSMASVKRRPDGQWRARYRDEAGKEHARHFGRRVEAQRWLDEVTASVITGQYVDPRSGRVTFREYAEQWRGGQVHRPSTQVYIERQLRRHTYPVLGDRPMWSIRPSDIQAWAKALTGDLAPSTVGVVHGIVSGIFRAAMRDRVIAHNPCDGTKLPKATKSRVDPLATEVVLALADAVPDRYRALVILSAGSGMRQGECFGLTVDRIHFLRRTVLVDRQLVTISRRAPFLAPPKTAASVRSIPVPTVVVDALAAHLAAFPPLEGGFVFVTDAGRPIRRTAFGDVWRPAVKAAGAPHGTGFHELRHYYASLLIRHGESVKVVQARLGHASASETLDTYSHLWPDSDDRTRTAVDSVLLADSVRTGEVVDGHNP